ncbi:MAG: hypothetical protein KME26_19565 [Oscillatoria princeps RMCB-10]|nr:hypothetical protein [Oscillatoria princeps RMCB-10]
MAEKRLTCDALPDNSPGKNDRRIGKEARLGHWALGIGDLGCPDFGLWIGDWGLNVLLNAPGAMRLGPCPPAFYLVPATA